MEQKKIRFRGIVSNDDLGKIPPQDVTMEQWLLGALIMFPKHIGIFKSYLQEDLFYKHSHRVIINAMTTLFSSNKPIDLITLVHELRATNKLEDAEGVYYVSLLTNNATPLVHIGEHIRILYELSLRRELIRISSEYVHKCYDLSYDVFEIVIELQKELSAIMPKKGQFFGFKQADVVVKTVSSLSEVVANVARKPLTTGHTRLDSILGLNKGPICVAGGGGIGKTTFITSLMKNIYERHGSEIATLWYVLDHESGGSINLKFLAQDMKKSVKELKGFNKGQHFSMDTVMMHTNKYKSWKIEFVEKKTSINDIMPRWRTFVEDHHDYKCILIIDNLMKLSEMTGMKHTIDVDDYVMNAIGDLYREFMDKEPIIIFLHHFTKDQVDRSNMGSGLRPTISNIKGSGRVFDTVEIVLLLNRPGAYDTLLNEYPNAKDVLESLFLVDVAKNTDGELGVVRFFCHPGYGIYKEIN